MSSYRDSPNKDYGAKSFVDILTIDYRKTLNDYKNRLMEDVRKKAVSNQFSKGSISNRSMISNRDEESSFVDCLKGDHNKQVFDKKQ